MGFEWDYYVVNFSYIEKVKGIELTSAIRETVYIAGKSGKLTKAKGIIGHQKGHFVKDLVSSSERNPHRHFVVIDIGVIIFSLDLSV